MDNIRAAIDLLFNRRRFEKIMSSHFEQDIQNRCDTSVDRDWFCRHFRNDYNIYSNDQIESVFEILNTNWMKYGKRNLHSVFNVLLYFSDTVLTCHMKEPKCQYHQLLRWHEISVKVGEDLFTTSFLASKDVESGITRKSFSWKPIIGHDNPAINCMFEKGLADLHFHLKGSSLNFDVNWLCLMNHIANRRAEFRKLYKLQSSMVLTNQEDKVELLHTLCVKACAIRLLLFTLMIGDNIDECKVINPILSSKDLNEINLYILKLQNKISLVKSLYGHRYGKDTVDYAIDSNLTECHIQDVRHYINSILSGERGILYHAFYKIYSGDVNFAGYTTLFYAYLVAKERLRHEFIQLNEKIGFANFAQYEERKELFILKNSIYDTLITNLAINSSEKNQNIEYIEARITPKNSSTLISQIIRKLDRQVNDARFIPLIENSLEKEQNIPNKFHYILHFIKKRSTPIHSSTFKIISCRNILVRQQVKKQSFAIIKLRQKSPAIGARIVGIDAANTEIQCRPEVFAQAFRFLRNYPCQDNWEYVRNLPIKKLGVTYHVGEDYLDIVDGLMAIDEAIIFLNLTRGDRLGHALALGVDADAYYQMKNKRVVMPKQDFLDNVVWLLTKSNVYGVDLPPELESKLKNWFESIFIEIYGAENKPSIYTYYQSWLLRGDAPEMYLNESDFKKEKLSFWESYSLNHDEAVNNARSNPEARNLYYRYHYDYEARLEGSKSDEFIICYSYIQMVDGLQAAMRCKLARQHICIETNLTSNNVIGFFKRYASHPITKFYNKGLNIEGESHDVAQISVSINTDDQGIFCTTIENEFSLIALSLEKQKDAGGKPLFTPRMVYQWLDNVRELAFEQKFFREEHKSGLE